MDKCGWRCAMSATSTYRTREQADKLVHTHNTTEAYRLVCEVSGVTQGGTPLAQKTSTGAMVFGPATVPPTTEYFARMLSVINPVAEDRLMLHESCKSLACSWPRPPLPRRPPPR